MKTNILYIILGAIGGYFFNGIFGLVGGLLLVVSYTDTIQRVSLIKNKLVEKIISYLVLFFAYVLIFNSIVIGTVFTLLSYLIERVSLSLKK